MISNSLLLCSALIANPQEAQDAGGCPEDFRVTLCQSVDASGAPLGATHEFFADSRELVVQYSAADSIPAGHEIRVRLLDSQGSLLCASEPVATDGSWNAGSLNVPIAGCQWPLDSGPFTVEVYWDAQDEPCSTRTFTLKAAKRWGLCIGMADYPPEGEGGPDLPSITNTPMQFRDMLVDSFGFAEDSVETLCSLAATKAAIESALEELAKKAEPEDAVVIYYIGHGTQIPDLDGDEEDGWDEALCPAEITPDFVTEEDQLRGFLPDDRIAQLLQKFKTRNVTVILESCHSGTAVRAGGTPQLRGLKHGYDLKVDFDRKLIDKAQEASEDAPDRPVEQSLDLDERFVFLHASRAWETAQGDSDGGFLAQALFEILPYSEGKSWDDLLPEILDKVADLGSLQCPGIEGAARRFPFLLTERTEEALYIRPSLRVLGAKELQVQEGADEPQQVECGSSGTHLAIVRGHSSLYHEQAGAALDVYSSGDPLLVGFTKGRVVLNGNYENFEGFDSAAADIESGEVEAGDRLVPVTVRIPGVDPSVGVAVSDPSDPPEATERLSTAANALANLLQATAGVQFRSTWDLPDVDYIIEPKELNGRAVTCVFAMHGKYLTSFDGTDEGSVRGAVDFVRKRHAESTRLMRLSNPSPGFRFQATLPEGRDVFGAGNPISVRAQADKPCMFAAFLVDENGELLGSAVHAKLAAEQEIVSLRIAPAAGSLGSMRLKVFATDQVLEGFATVGKDSSANLASRILQVMQQHYGAGDQFLNVEGWADRTLGVQVE